MAILLTKDYQEISRINLNYADLITYAKYITQSRDTNSTTYQLKTTYYIPTQSYVTFGSANAYLDDAVKTYGYTTFNRGETTVQEITRTITHNEDGSSPTKSVYSAFYASFGGGGETTAEVVFPAIQRYAIATSGTNFTDEENPTLTFSNIGLYSLRAKISVGNTEVYSADLQDQTVTSYTYSLTTAQRNQLRQLCTGQSVTVTLSICSVDNNTILYTSSANVTMSMVNARPTFTKTELETNANVVSFLGTDSGATIINNVSALKVTVTPTTYKYATVRNVRVASGETYIGYKTSSPYEFVIPSNSLASSYTIMVSDSRGYVVGTSVSKTLVDYEPVKINSFNFKRESPVSSNIILNADILYYNEVGGISNTPVVKWKLDDGSYNTIPSSNYTIDTTNNKLTIINYELTNALVYTSQGQFALYVEDELTSTQDAGANGLVLKGVPTFDAGEHDLKVNGTLYIADQDGNNKVDVLALLQNSQPKYIQAYQSTRYTPSITAWQLTPLWISNADTNDSSMFVFSDLQDRITIGAGVSKIEVSTETSWWQASSSGEFDVQIMKNGSSLGNEFIAYGTTSTDIESRAISPMVIDVQQGDYIQVGFTTGTSSIEVLNNRIYIKKIS